MEKKLTGAIKKCGSLLLLLIIMGLVYLSDIIPVLLNGVPLSVYVAYLDAKLNFNCETCYYHLTKCEDFDGAAIYAVSGWYMQSWGRELFFDATGHQLCNAKPTFTECKGGCKEIYAGCPMVQSCHTVPGAS